MTSPKTNLKDENPSNKYNDNQQLINGNSYTSSGNKSEILKSIKRSSGTLINKRKRLDNSWKESFKTEDELEHEYKIILDTIKKKDNYRDITSLICNNTDMEYFLKNNNMDYYLYKATIIHRKQTQMKNLEDSGINFNTDTFIIEYHRYIGQFIVQIDGKEVNEYIDGKIFPEVIDKEARSDENVHKPETFMAYKDFEFMIDNECGKFFEPSTLFLEFYYLLFTHSYNLAVRMLNTEYANNLKNFLNKIFLEDDDKLLRHIITSPELARTCVILALDRSLDGIALDIINKADIFMDEEILEKAIARNCNLFLEEMWDSINRIGSVKNFFAPKIPFSTYIELMIKHKNYTVASDSLKFWKDTYKQENLFSVLLQNNSEELAIDLIERMFQYNKGVEITNEQMGTIIRKHYLLLKHLVGKPIYKNILNNSDVQKTLVDALRKGQTILAALECYNLMNEDYLDIENVGYACDVLIEFCLQPKQFSFCRHPLLLCCLACEFSEKMKNKFPIYTQLFNNVIKNYLKAGKLFAQKVKEENVLRYHISVKDLRNRTCLQIMAQNSLYKILSVEDIGAIISKEWNGKTSLYGFTDLSSYTYMTSFNLESEMMKFRNISRAYNENRTFYFNYYCFRDVCYLRFLFKEAINIILVLIYCIVIYLSVTAGNLEESYQGNLGMISTLAFYASFSYLLNKIQSVLFFSFVDRWYIEQDNTLIEIIFIVVLIFHNFNLKAKFINMTDMITVELIDAILLSIINLVLFWKMIHSMRVSKFYGAFLRLTYVITAKLMRVIVLLLAFIALCTAIFVLLLKGNDQFRDYYYTFFVLYANVVNKIEFTYQSNFYLSMVLYLIFTTFTNIVFINFVLSFMSNVIDEIGDTDDEEHRCNLIKVTEYLKFDEEYGIFKFLHAPFSIFTIPLEFFITAIRNRVYWNDIYCKASYFLVAFFYFLGFLVVNAILWPIAQIRLVFKNLFFDIGESNRCVRIAFAVFLVPVLMIYYYFLDIYNFWVNAYSFIENTEEKEKLQEEEKNIMEIREVFQSLAASIAEYIKKNKKKKKFHALELVSNWVMKTKEIISNREVNNPHRKYLLEKKYNINDFVNDPSKLNKLKQTHAAIIKATTSKGSISQHFQFIYDFVLQFCDNTE